MKKKNTFFLMQLLVIRSCKTVNIIVSLQMSDSERIDLDFVK